MCTRRNEYDVHVSSDTRDINFDQIECNKNVRIGKYKLIYI